MHERGYEPIGCVLDSERSSRRLQGVEQIERFEFHVFVTAVVEDPLQCEGANLLQALECDGVLEGRTLHSIGGRAHRRLAKRSAGRGLLDRIHQRIFADYIIVFPLSRKDRMRGALHFRNTRSLH